MKSVIGIPTEGELKAFLKILNKLDITTEDTVLEKCRGYRIHDSDTYLFQCGLGKVEYAVTTRYILDNLSDTELFICAGACGSLISDLSFGDIIIATHTVEHDIRVADGKYLPEYQGDKKTVDRIRKKVNLFHDKRYRFGKIASGDEHVVFVERREEIRKQTKCIAVAWEGAGGARACSFSDVPYLEVRGVSDMADEHAVKNFWKNLQIVMENLAGFILQYILEGNTGNTVK